MAITNVTQVLSVNTLAGEPSIGAIWVAGTSKAARKIGEQNLPSDFVLTEIQVNCTALRNANGNNPAIIRVYQYGRESSAVTIEIASTGIFIQPISLGILSRYGAERKVIVDAWDPDTGSPNNSCSLRGTVSVAGRPYYSIGGATNQIAD
jgi:hypothetical protein